MRSAGDVSGVLGGAMIGPKTSIMHTTHCIMAQPERLPVTVDPNECGDAMRALHQPGEWTQPGIVT